MRGATYFHRTCSLRYSESVSSNYSVGERERTHKDHGSTSTKMTLSSTIHHFVPSEPTSLDILSSGISLDQACVPRTPFD
jgi:hypothetical protein